MIRHLIVLFLTSVILSAYSQTKPILKIGLVADPQYANKSTEGNRYYRLSLLKLSAAIDTFNCNQIDFVQNLGDIIDEDWGSFDSILPVYKKLNSEIENYQLLGNHDYAVDSSQIAHILEVLSMPDFYYSYVKRGWRFIVLDATDYAYYSSSLHQRELKLVDYYYKKTIGKPNHYRWNSAVGPMQQRWLKQELDLARSLHQKVIIFSHKPIRPFNQQENIWNDGELTDIIEKDSNVVAFINGHKHAGNYVFKNGIHYITIYGMVESKKSSFGILEIFKDNLVLKGYGHQETYLKCHVPRINDAHQRNGMDLE